MSEPLQIILLLVLLVAVLLFLIKIWFKDNVNTRIPKIPPSETREEVPLDTFSQLVELEEEPHFFEEPKSKPQKHPDILVINVIAKPGETFASYDLFQAISATGLQFGAMNIFHYYANSEDQKKILFSLASMTEPGEFDLNHMGEFTCAGLSLFMNLADTNNSEEVFALMLDTAEQLADDLQGELYANPETPWSDEILSNYQKKITEYTSLYAFT